MSEPELLTAMRRALAYDPHSGVLTWRVRPKQSKVRVGQEAGCEAPDGYRVMKFAAKNYHVHRVAWFIHHGRWPADQLDHVNGNRGDNRLANLRECTGSENNQNRKAKKGTATGFLGVSKQAGNRYGADIMVDGRSQHLGRFDTPQAAAEAYRKAKRHIHTFQPEVRE